MDIRLVNIIGNITKSYVTNAIQINLNFFLTNDVSPGPNEDVRIHTVQEVIKEKTNKSTNNTNIL